MQYDVYTDGSCLDNGRAAARGGWGLAITYKNTDQIVSEGSGKLRPGRQDNNRAEAEAFLYGLLWIDQHYQEGDTYSVWSDSMYVVECVTGIGTRAANRDIWSQIETICARIAGSFEVRHIESHMKNSECIQHIMNDYTDKLAKIAANNLTLKAVNPAV